MASVFQLMKSNWDTQIVELVGGVGLFFFLSSHNGSVISCHFMCVAQYTTGMFLSFKILQYYEESGTRYDMLFAV